jgi:hypothetical protein
MAAAHPRGATSSPELPLAGEAVSRERGTAESSEPTPTADTEETAMHHTLSYHLVQARIADLRGQAQRASLSRVVRRARPGQPPELVSLTRHARPAAAARETPSPQ